MPMVVTVITGASSGIGRSLARRLAARGETVVALARRKELLDSLVDEIERDGGRAGAVACDVTDRDAVHRAFEEVEARFGPPDRLIANAGGGSKTKVEDFRAAQIEELLALNVLGVANCIEAVLPGMRARRQGHIVATSSLAAYRGLPRAAAYCGAKAALSAMMESLRVDLAPHGIDVTLLVPGFVRTKPKKKPLQVELEAATARMERAIVRRRRRYAFPLSLVLAMNLARALPAPIYDSPARANAKTDKS
jgi:NAD(P)-dependent dehydrogenase (short-subunit alcohol dehydrogenase family)